MTFDQICEQAIDMLQRRGRVTYRALKAQCRLGDDLLDVLERYEGHMAQYLGDGLLVYFGWPLAHEDDAQRAAHAGLGIVHAITTTLNARLEREKGVQLIVRI